MKSMLWFFNYWLENRKWRKFDQLIFLLKNDQIFFHQFKCYNMAKPFSYVLDVLWKVFFWNPGEVGAGANPYLCPYDEERMAEEFFFCLQSF